MSAPILTANGLSKAFGPKVLLKDVDLAIGARERVGLVGDNGAGKSTLAKILAGMEPLDGGEIAIRRDARVGYLSQRPALDDDATARDVVLSGMGRWRDALQRHADASEAMGRGDGDLDALLETQSQAAADVERLGGWTRERDVEATLTHLGIHEHDAAVGRMSGGERRRVDLARLLVSSPDLAILDEPTNHLDVETIEWLEAHLKDVYPGALLLVTHDRYVLEHVAQRTLELDHGSVFAYKGGWSAYLDAKATRLELEARTEANRQSFVRTELEWLRRSPSARSTKQKARIQRAHAAIDTAAPVARTATKLALETQRLGGTILELNGVTISPAPEVEPLVRDFDFRLMRGDRVGILGPSGCGKTTMLRCILGDIEPVHGEVVRGKNTRIAYFDQARTGLDEGASIHENVAGKATRVELAGQPMDIRSYMARFLFDGRTLQQKVGALSGGERARVALAKLLLQPANLLVFDEPTNDLDVATLGSLETLLDESDATAIIVSHDRYFLDRVANAIVACEGEGKWTRYAGAYRDYLSQRGSRRTEVATARKTAKPTPQKRKPALSSKEQRELSGMMKRIEQAEADLAKLEAALADPDLYSDGGDKAAKAVTSRDEANLVLEKLMARWEELELKREAAT